MSAVIFLTLFLFTRSAFGAPEEAVSIVKRSRAVAMSPSFSSLVTLNQNDGTKIYKSKIFVKNTANSSRIAIFCQEPVDLKGSAFLTLASGDQVARKWFYLPVVGSPRESSATQHGMKILGTDIRFFDFAPPPLSSFRYSFLPDQDGRSEVWRIKAVPVAKQVTKDFGITSVSLEIAKDTFLTMRSIVTLEDGRRRTMEIKKVLLSGGWSIPTVVEYRLKDGDTVASQTRVELSELDTKTPLDDDLFDPKRLNRAP